MKKFEHSELVAGAVVRLKGYPGEWIIREANMGEYIVRRLVRGSFRVTKRHIEVVTQISGESHRRGQLELFPT